MPQCPSDGALPGARGVAVASRGSEGTSYSPPRSRSSWWRPGVVRRGLRRGVTESAPRRATALRQLTPASGGSRHPRLRSLEHELAVARVDADAVAGGELALEQLERELVDELLLDHPLERARAVGRVVAEVADQRARVVGELDLDAALADPPGELRHLEVDDLADLLARQRGELDDV